MDSVCVCFIIYRRCPEQQTVSVADAREHSILLTALIPDQSCIGSKLTPVEPTAESKSPLLRHTVAIASAAIGPGRKY